MAVTSGDVLTKQSTEKRQYTMDFSALMITGETISTPTVTSEYLGGDTSDLDITDIQVSGQTVTFWIADGTDKNRYRIDVLLNTSAGQILNGDGILKLSDK